MMHFRLFNIPVYIHPTFWLFLLFFTGAYRNFSPISILIGAVVLFSLLVHELGHALTARYFGGDPSIVLEGMGGRAQYTSRMTRKQEFLITLNGPLVESLLIVIPYALLKLHLFVAYPYIEYTLSVMMWLNILWCGLNLLPILPLDGGHLLRFFLERRFGEKGLLYSFRIGLLMSAVALPVLFFMDLFFFGSLILIFAFQNYQMLKGLKMPSQKDSPYKQYLKSIEAMEANKLEEAKKTLLKLKKATDQKIRSMATDSLAELYMRENAPDKAYSLLLNTSAQEIQKGKCLLCRLAFERGNYALIAKHAREIYEIETTFETALLNAKAYAYLGNGHLAGGWLVTASQFGKKVPIDDALFDEVRSSLHFQKHSQTL